MLRFETGLKINCRLVFHIFVGPCYPTLQAFLNILFIWHLLTLFYPSNITDLNQWFWKDKIKVNDFQPFFKISPILINEVKTTLTSNVKAGSSYVTTGSTVSSEAMGQTKSFTQSMQEMFSSRMEQLKGQISPGEAETGSSNPETRICC